MPGTDDQVDVNYSVEEQPSGSITASVGFAQSAGLILGGSISQNNFLGTGNKVSIGLTRSEYQTRYNFGFVDPYWTVDGVSLGYNAFYRTTDYDDLDVDVSSYSVDSLGGGVSVGYPINETSRLTFGLTVQQDEIGTGRYTVDEIFDFIRQEGDKYLNFKGSIGWSESTLNRGVLANRGHSQSLVLESTLPGSDLSFFKLDYRAQLFTPLSQSTALRWHTELGYGDSYGSTSELPFYEHYFAGGFNSVRGFEDSSLGPRSTPSTGRNPGTIADPDQDPLPFGGNVLVQGGVELLFPLPFVRTSASCVPCCSGMWVMCSTPVARPPRPTAAASTQAISPAPWVWADLDHRAGAVELQPGHAGEEAGQCRHPGIPVLPGPDLLIADQEDNSVCCRSASCVS